jgi:hypothetical protein
MESEETKGFKLIPVTWKHALKVWWSIVWRTLIYGFMAGFLIGFFAGITLSGLGLSLEKYQNLLNLLSSLVLILIQIGIIKYVLSKKYPDFRVALIKEEKK